MSDALNINKKLDPIEPPLSDTPGYWARLSQRRASDPDRSVWVNASAGTGKTKVLIERVLRLLLPRTNGAPGTRPHRILCLTYTKAASAEMTERLLARVSDWAVMSDSDLRTSLQDVLDEPPRADQIDAARRLFTQLIDGPDHVRILTLHAFCQSILSRFPLEAGISPHFTLIEGAELEQLLQTARQNADLKITRDPENAFILNDIAAHLSDFRLGQIMTELLSERRQLSSALAQYKGSDRAVAFRTMFGLNSNDSLETWTKSIADLPESFIHDLILLDQGLSKGTKTENGLAAHIRDWTMLHPLERAEHFDQICRPFFDSKGARSSDGGKQGQRKADDQLRLLYITCGDEIERLKHKRQMIDLYRINMALFTWVDYILTEYNQLKCARGVLDFDDLIRKTITLLDADQTHTQETKTPSWVMYKLDGGIDHILLDEAQDTNPEQWQIIASLARTFGPDDPDRTRRLFIVGDQKQSIYRFQGADPDTFEKMLHHFGSSNLDTPTNNSLHLDRIPMNTSFRSTFPVLTIVDQIFKNPDRIADLRLKEAPTHIIHRTGQAGRVEVWPMIPAIKDTEIRTPWTPPTTIRPHTDGPTILARKIAHCIHNWIDQKIILPSHNRPIEPRDIMILVRKRAPYLASIRAALQIKGIPVAGADRQPILDSIIVKDLVAITQFSLLPDDDLSLACVLKSPLCGGTDDDLIAIAPTRTGSLWAALQSYSSHHPWVSYLEQCIDRARTLSPYLFLTSLLDQPCPSSPDGSGRAAFLRDLSLDHTSGIEDLLTLALKASENSTTIHHFIHTLIRDNPEIRQSVAPSDNVVRLMTVHGSKGLESPIVILPDTIKSARDGKPASIFWPDDTDAPLPIFVPRAQDRPDDIPHVLEHVRAADRAEEQRLLYVALTRAQDWLIVAGADRPLRSDITWYDTVLNSIKACANLPGYRVEESGTDGPLHIFESAQTALPDRARKDEKEILSPSTPDIPERPPLKILKDTLKKPLIPEPTPARPYRADPAHMTLLATSPLLSINDPTRFARGLITHKLLEILPNLPKTTWEETIKTYLTKRSDILSKDIQSNITQSVLNILHHPDYKDLFHQNSHAEVPITGILPNGRLIAGQIDRLIITPTHIHILDYKTDFTIPKTPDQIPQAYLDQMRTYRDLLRTLYSTHTLQCSLLWTSGPLMMDVTDIL